VVCLILPSSFCRSHVSRSSYVLTLLPSASTRSWKVWAKVQQGTNANGLLVSNAKSTMSPVAWSGWSPTTTEHPAMTRAASSGSNRLGLICSPLLAALWGHLKDLCWL